MYAPICLLGIYMVTQTTYLSSLCIPAHWLTGKIWNHILCNYQYFRIKRIGLSWMSHYWELWWYVCVDRSYLRIREFLDLYLIFRWFYHWVAITSPRYAYNCDILASVLTFNSHTLFFTSRLFVSLFDRIYWSNILSLISYYYYTWTKTDNIVLTSLRKSKSTISSKGSIAFDLLRSPDPFLVTSNNIVRHAH